VPLSTFKWLLKDRNDRLDNEDVCVLGAASGMAERARFRCLSDNRGAIMMGANGTKCDEAGMKGKDAGTGYRQYKGMDPMECTWSQGHES
jgi:hypothetical protein